MHVWTQVVTKWSWYTPAYSPFFDSRSLRKLVTILFWTWPTKHVNHWRTLLLAQDPLPNSPRILFRARPDHLLSLPRVPCNAPTGSSSDIKESKWVDHLYVDWPVAKQQYTSNAGITGPTSPARLTSYIPLWFTINLPRMSFNDKTTRGTVLQSLKQKCRHF